MPWNEAEKLLEEELKKHYPPKFQQLRKALTAGVLTLGVAMTSACGDWDCSVDEVLCSPSARTSSPADPTVVGSGASPKSRYTSPVKSPAKTGDSSSSRGTQRSGFGKSGGGMSAGS